MFRLPPDFPPRFRKPLRLAVILALLSTSAPAYADVAPGPVEFSMFAFVWVMTTVVLGGVIYLIATRLFRKQSTAAPAGENSAPSLWKRPVFRRSIAVAGVIAFIGWFALISWLLEVNRQQREDQRMRYLIEQQERKTHSPR